MVKAVFLARKLNWKSRLVPAAHRRRAMLWRAGFWAIMVLAAPVNTVVGQPCTLTNEWKLEVKTAVDSSPAIGLDGTIYFGTFSGQLWAVNPDGTQKWTFTTGRGGRMGVEIRSSPAVGDDGTIYFGCRDRRLYAITPEGKLKWTFETGGWADSSPALGADGTVYVGSWDKKLYAVDAGGRMKWSFATGDPITSSPAIGKDGAIYFGSHDGKFYALNPDGKKLWEFKTGGAIISSPAIAAEGTLYFTSVDGWFHAVNPDGSERWKLKAGGVTESSPVIGPEGRIFLGVNKDIWAISPAGEKVWQRWVTSDAYQEPVEATPIATAQGSVIVISGYGWLTEIEQPSLVSKWGFYTYGYDRATPALAPNGMVYVPHYNLHAVKTQLTLADSPWPRFRGNAQNTGRSQER